MVQQQGRYTLSGGEDGKIVVWTHASGTELMDVDLAQVRCWVGPHQ